MLLFVIFVLCLNINFSNNAAGGSSSDRRSLHGFIFQHARVYQTSERMFLHPAAVNEPFLIE